MNKITIIGTGLIGTSMGLAIKSAGCKGIRVVGTDRDRGRAATAQKMGALDEASGSLGNAVNDAQIVILATPVMEMKELMEAIGPRLPEGCLVTDTGGTKGVVLEWADKYLPHSVNFVGGQPMVAKEGSGPEAADAKLFQGRPYCVVPASGARQDAVRLLTDLINSMGAKPYFIDVGEHDSFMSAVGHLPFLMSVALVGCTSKSPSWDDIAKIASTPYRNATSMVSGDPTTYKDLAVGNTKNIVSWLDALINELYDIRQILNTDADQKGETLGKVLNEAFTARARWMAGLVTPESQAAINKERMPSASESMAGFFVGDSGARRRLFGWGEGRGDKQDRGKKQ